MTIVTPGGVAVLGMHTLRPQPDGQRQRCVPGVRGHGMSHGRSLLTWYRDTSRAKWRGRWRPSASACFGVFILLSPMIILIEGLVCIGVARTATALSLPPLVTMVATVVVGLAVAVIVAQLLYFGFREGRVEQDGPRCQSCGYDLTGNVSGVCPECGRPT
jgi:hypothetical protein